MMWIVDTNILIYALTNHPNFASLVRTAFQEAKAKNITLFLSAAVVAEALYVLEGQHFQCSREEAADALERVVIAEGIQCQDQGAVLYALHRHRDSGLDFVDAYCAGLAKSSGAVLLTNDREIAKKTGVVVRNL